MTALSPGPWTFDADDGLIAGSDGRLVGVADEGGERPDEFYEPNGRAMASAHEALEVLRELAMPEEELMTAFEEATGIKRPDLAAPMRSNHAAYHHWVWLRNDVLRTKAEKVLEKAGMRP